MDARVVTTNVQVAGRNFTIKKYPVATGMKIALLLAEKVIPVAKPVLPLIKTYLNGESEGLEAALSGAVEDIESFLNLDVLSDALHKVTEDDLEYIIRSSLMCCFEIVAGGHAQVMTSGGTYGAIGIDGDYMLILRLTYEAVKWSVRDFFTAGSWSSMFGKTQDTSPLLQSI